MTTIVRRFAVIAALLLMVPCGAARGDRIERHPSLDRLNTARIAILPVVSAVDDPAAATAVERAWIAYFAKSGHDWLPAQLTREVLRTGSHRPDSLVKAITSRIRKGGGLDSATSRAVLGRLRRDALLCLRLDRWSREQPYATGYVTVATVEITATLVDSNGTALWRADAEESQEARYGVPAGMGGGSGGSPRYIGGSQTTNIGIQLPSGSSAGSGARSRPIAGRGGPDLEMALGRILARWLASFPESRAGARSSAAGIR